MVFESLVADLLNRFLGEYVENLDAKQLNVGILGGDVVLRDLEVKPKALDKLDLPLKLRSGSLGKLTLKVPWNNLYVDSVEAIIEDLYVVAAPITGMKYDAQKEGKQMQEEKQRELQRLEDERKEKRKKPDPAQKEKEDTFVEKLVTQVIKNLQVTILNVHIRYEDEHTNAKRPFAMGVTLDKLEFKTDKEQKPGPGKEMAKTFFKVVNLGSLAIYWNSGTQLISHRRNDELKRKMKEMVATKKSTPKDINYMLAPINLTAQLFMNPKPEAGQFKIPKVKLSVDMKQLEFDIGRFQYQDILEFLEAQERLKLNAKYRKYRPYLNVYQKHEKEWWRFVIACNKEGEVKRKTSNWSWRRMKAHLEVVEKYTNAWVQKRTNTAPSKEILRTIEKAENELDVYNLNVARQRAELYIDQKKLKRVEEQGGILNYVKSWWGWGGGGGGGGAGKATGKEDVATMFEKAMTAEERAKLYEAMDYQENQTPMSCPKEFIETKISFTLEALKVIVEDDLPERRKLKVMILTWQEVKAEIEQHPSAKAIKLNARMQKFQVEGIQKSGGERPTIVSMLAIEEEKEKDLPQILFQFETNPLNGAFDQFVKFHTRPLSVIYDSASVNKLIEVFRPPESVRLKQLAAAAFAKYENMRDLSAAGLQYALEKRSVLMLDVKILPTIIQIPDNGVMKTSSNILVVDLGTLQITTETVSKVKTDETFYKKSEEEKLKLLRESAYDKFKLELKSLQVLFSRPADNWRKGRTQNSTYMHVLQPTGWQVLIAKAAVDDVRLSKLRITGQLPDLKFGASDTRLLDILKLLMSIPMPPPSPEAPAGVIDDVVEPTTWDRVKMKAILEASGDELREEAEAEDEEEDEAKKTGVERARVLVDVAVVLNQIWIDLTNTIENESHPYMGMSLASIKLKFKMRPMDMHATVSLGSLEVQYLKDAGGGLYLLDNPSKKTGSNTPLLFLEYIQAEKNNPLFASKFGMTEQLVKVKGQPLNVTLHQEVLVDIEQFLKSLQKRMDALKQSSSARAAEPPKQQDVTVARRTKSSQHKVGAEKLTTTRPQVQVDDRVVSMKVEAEFSQLVVVIAISKRVLSNVSVEGLTAKLAMKPRIMETEIRLKSVGITDPSPDSTYGKILSVAGKEVLSLHFVQHIRSEKERREMGVKDFDMEVKLSFAEMRFVFLNVWLSKMMSWLTPFQEAAAVAADQAGQAVQKGAQNAADVLKEIHQKTKRINLNIKMHAPVVIIPQTSKSNEAFLADFGNLLIENTFEPKPLRKGGKEQVILDHIRMYLHDVKLSRIILAQDRWNVVAECQILHPVSFLLYITRNLSYSYYSYKDKPELKINAKLTRLKIAISHEDYEVATKTLSGNLAEGARPNSSSGVQKKEPSIAEGERREASSEAGVESEAAKRQVKLEFLFEAETIEAKLYEGSSNLVKGVVSRDRKKELASVEIQKISVPVDIMENGDMRAEVHLFGLTMDDSRIDRADSSITRLMDKKGNDAARRENMIDIRYKKDTSNNQIAELRLRPFFLVFCPEFLGKLSRFFLVPKSDESALEEPSIRQEVTVIDDVEGQQKPVHRPATEDASAVGTMTVQVLIENSEIALVDDTPNAEDTDVQGIILKFFAELKLESKPNTTKIEAGISRLKVTSGYFDSRRRSENSLTVLSSCDINLDVSTPKGFGQCYQLSVTPVKIRISPSVIRVLSNVAASLAVSPKSSAQEKQTRTVSGKVWDKTDVAKRNFWFLNRVRKSGSGVGSRFAPAEEVSSDENMQDKFLVHVSKIELTLETDGGARTVPMIHVAASFHADIREWTKRLYAKAVLPLEMWYYNEKFNDWEPLLETVVCEDGSQRPWQLEAFVMQHDEYGVMGDSEIARQPPKLQVTLVAEDNLQLTVTKTLLELITDMSDAFSRAAKRIKPKEMMGLPVVYPWCIRNLSNEYVDVMDSDAFSPHREWRGCLPYLAIVELQCKVPERKSIDSSDDKKPMLLLLSFPAFQAFRDVDVARAERRIFRITTTNSDDQIHVVVDTTSHSGNKLITIRSRIKFVNHLPIDIDIYCERKERAGTVESDDREFSPGLRSVQTPTGEFLLYPSEEGLYGFGQPAIKWREIERNADWHMLITCPSIDGNKMKDYFILASVEIDDAYDGNTHRKNTETPCYVIHLSAPVLFRNALPYRLEISAVGVNPISLISGASASLSCVAPQRAITMKVHANYLWTCDLVIDEDFEDLSQHTFHSRLANGGIVEMDLGLRTVRRLGTQEMTLYCPFWMINKTGKQLSYKIFGKIRPARRKRSESPFKVWFTPKRAQSASPVRSRQPGQQTSSSQPPTAHFVTVFEHAPGFVDPLLFSFSGDAYFAKNKKMLLKVANSGWSDAFPLDIVGSAGRVSCKVEKEKEFEVSVNIQLSYSGLTKIVTFTPFYMVDNRTSADIEVRQSEIGINQVIWTRIPKKECRGFWPEKNSKSKRMQMTARYTITNAALDPKKAESQPFPFTESFESLVKTQDESVGFYVTSHVSDNAVVLVLEQFQDGMAPVLLVNNTENLEVWYNQKGVDRRHSKQLPAGKCIAYAWTNMMMSRVLLWSCGDAKNIEDTLMKDGVGEIMATKKVKVYWVSFLSGRQRVLLFTQDLAVATTAWKPYELERADQQYKLILQSISLSLVNNMIGREIASMAITSSGVIWEYKKGRFRAFSIKDNRRLEEAHLKYRDDLDSGKQPKSRVKIGTGMEVDFKEMKQYKPKEREIRRSHQGGLWLEYTQSPHELQLHLMINHFQIDNQLPICSFPVAFAPVPPPKSVMAESVPKPFVEVSFIMRKEEHGGIPQVKYFKFLVQEMSLQVDKGFINAMIEMFTNELAVTYGTDLYEKDRDITRQGLTQLAAVTSSTERKAYYERLHFSPMKIHFSFSQGSDEGGKAAPIHSELLNLLLKSVGVTLTEVQDVRFQLAYFERTAVIMSRQQLINEAVSHYTRQIIKQLYVLVLGLDIMGNPFELIRDLSKGAEAFFYEPIQGAVQGPEEFAEGLALGLKGLFGGAVGGAAGAVSRITGTLGKALAVLTLDEEYQRSRRRALSRRPGTAGEGLARGAQGLAMGFVEGVTGVFSKPVEGAKKGGVGGFVKGVGVGFVGLVTRPVSGMVDFASSSMQALKMATGLSEDVKKLRPARFILPEKIVRPLEMKSAEGNQLLQEAGKGKYATSDVYIAHAMITAQKEFYCIVTDRRIMVVSKSMGAWKIDWYYRWTQLVEAPKMTDHGLAARLKVPERKATGSLRGGRLIMFQNKEDGKMIAARAKDAFERAQ